MSTPVLKHYYEQVEKLTDFSGARNEITLRTAFFTLLNEYARMKNLMVVPEIRIMGTKGRIVIPDGALKDALRQDLGYWESKDEYDDLEQEIQNKFERGYPKENILFEDGKRAILYQHGQKVLDVLIANEEALDEILKRFVNFEKKEVLEFRDAIEHFKADIPQVTESLRKIIIEQEQGNSEYNKAKEHFLAILRESVNPNLSTADVREIVIQHILTADIFNTVFDEVQFHRENNIAQELEKVVDTFFTRDLRRATVERIRHYYQTIKAHAAQIADHHEKQRFLKVVYENFYKSYNPKAADRLGVVYTPNEIVRFMIESVDSLLYTHFNKYLYDKDVEILDPCTGTGTFICELIDYLPSQHLNYKYENEIHANEVAILPYYIANLNIEYTYAQKMRNYKEFNNLCLVDTLDNMGFSHKGQQFLFAVTEENTKRIQKQNKKKISVIIGNPPYNANQQSENEDNKNREYKIIDERIKESFVKYSSAQKTKVYDMYARFYRWAMDRIGDDGIIAFVSNRSFVSAKTFDGFRKCIRDEFNFAYIIDLGGDIRELSGLDGIFLNEKHTIFGISAAVGIAICFLVKIKGNRNKCRINYIHPCDIRATRDEKIMYLYSYKILDMPFQLIQPDKKNNWINISKTNFQKLRPVFEEKSAKGVFTFCSLGVSTNRDGWVYDRKKSNLIKKIKYFIQTYNSIQIPENYKGRIEDIIDYSIKWSSTLKRHLQGKRKLKFKQKFIIQINYRPFTKRYFYSDKLLNDRLTQNHYRSFGEDLTQPNKVIVFSGIASNKPFQIFASTILVDLHFLGDARLLPLYLYDEVGNKTYNISKETLKDFREHYKTKKIQEEDIFHYVYAVLNNPSYQKKYALDLKQDLPRLPLYKDFEKWKLWGEKLFKLHTEYESLRAYNINVIHEKEQKEFPKVKLKALKEEGKILLDENTSISEIPKEVWEYKLGNRSALEWILDQAKESSEDKLPEEFLDYKFSEHKQEVIDLIAKVCTVSLETIKIFHEMEKQEDGECEF